MPKWITPLDPRCRHYAARVGVVSATLGEALIPWQTEAARLITATDPDQPGAWRYPLVIITVPRQSGKSTLLRSIHLDRLLKPLPTGRRPQPTKLWMTAQHGIAARARFADLVNRIQHSPALAPISNIRRSAGTEHIAVGNVALSPFAPTPNALHGESTPFVSIDEAWAFDEPAAATLLAAITPAQQAFTGSQLVVISTAGTRDSRWLWSLIKAGRESVSDPESRIGYLEYSADPKWLDPDCDPTDPAALDFHPAIGTLPSDTGAPLTAEHITSLYPAAGGNENIRRGFLNLWPTDMDTAASRDLTAYDECLTDTPPDPTGPTVFAADVAIDRAGAAIYAAYPTATGVHIEHAASAAGTAWLRYTMLPDPLWYDPTGYTGATLSAHTRGNEADQRTIADATATLLTLISERKCTITAPPTLRDQYRDARTRPAGGTGFVFDPRTPDAIDHLRAAALAAHHAAQPSTIPSITF